MLCEIIHPNFRLDLRGKQLSLVEENSWFNDRFFVKYSYPFTFEITSEIERQLEMVTQPERRQRIALYEVQFLVEGERKDAIFVIEGVQGREGRGKVSYGFDELPGWGNKIASLPLIDEEISGNFYAFAKTIALQSYPAVNYSFPKIAPGIEAFDITSDRWQYFDGFLNNYVNDAFVENEFDVTENLEVNRNVMQPMPYIMYLLKIGFLNEGYILEGDILQDQTLAQAIVVSLSSFYQATSAQSEELQVTGEDYTDVSDDGLVATYATPHTFTEAGRYVISGSSYVRTMRQGQISRSVIIYKQQLVFEKNNLSSFHFANYDEKFFQIDIILDVFNADIGQEVFFQSLQYPFARGANNELIEDPIIFDVTIAKIASYDANDEAQTTLNIPSQIKLSECVPDITFGDLFGAVRNLKNYDLTLTDDKAIVNKIEGRLQTLSTIDLSMYEKKWPALEFLQDEYFILKYAEVDNESFDNTPLYIDRNGTSSDVFQEDQATVITINVIPLPQIITKEELTALMMVDDRSKLQLTLFQGIVSGSNNTVSAADFNLDTVYANDYAQWLDFRLNSHKISPNFSCTPEFARTLNVYKQCYMYKGMYLPKIITKNLVSKDKVEVSIEAYRI